MAGRLIFPENLRRPLLVAVALCIMMVSVALLTIWDRVKSAEKDADG